MSGIAGLYYSRTPKPVEPSRLHAMRDALAHRGPDGSGSWFAPGVALAHRRLATVDVDTGGQPMVAADGAIVAVCDGTICDFHDVRTILEAAGARFETESDAEVLLHGWRAWGPDLLRRLNGEFAFAIHDAERQCLFLARDRLGAKPLVYVELSDGALAFASEIKALAAHPLFRREADFRAVEDYMALGHVPDDASFLTGVRKLPAGHFLLVERGKPVPQPIRWWDVDFFTRATARPRELEAELIERMRAAVRARMIADVPLGAMLSGDADSGAVVALMAEASKAAVRTRAVTFGEGDPTELVAGRFHTEHRARAVPPDDFALIDVLVEAFDEPFADVSALAAYRGFAFARETLAVVLCADGAPEALAGHARYRRRLADRAGLIGAIGRLYPQSPHTGAAIPTVTPPELRLRLYSDGARGALGAYRGEQRYADTMRQAPARDGLDRAQYADIKLGLPSGALTRTDRASMAVGLEAREPLLDYRLVEFAATLPSELRIRGGQGQWLMKKALEPYLPREILYRPPSRQAERTDAWFRGPLAEEAAMLARSPLLGATGWFDLKAVEQLALDHRSGRAAHGRTLWQLMLLDRSLKRLFG